MKRLLVPASFLTLILLSCHKDKSPIGPTIDPNPIDTLPTGIDTMPYASVFWGDFLWEPTAYGAYDMGINAPSLRGFMSLGFVEPNDNCPLPLFFMRIRYFKLALGKQPLARGLTQTQPYGDMGFFDCDAPVESYFVDTSKTPNYIELTHIDTTKHMIEGVFNFSLYRTGDTLSNPPEPGLLNRYDIKEGRFRVKYHY